MPQESKASEAPGTSQGHWLLLPPSRFLSNPQKCTHPHSSSSHNHLQLLLQVLLLPAAEGLCRICPQLVSRGGLACIWWLPSLSNCHHAVSGVLTSKLGSHRSIPTTAIYINLTTQAHTLWVVSDHKTMSQAMTRSNYFTHKAMSHSDTMFFSPPVTGRFFLCPNVCISLFIWEKTQTNQSLGCAISDLRLHYHFSPLLILARRCWAVSKQNTTNTTCTARYFLSR